MLHGSFQNMQAANTLPKPDFAVGDGAPIVMWTDRQACTIIAIQKNGRLIVLQEDTATRTDKNGMSDAQAYTFERNLQGRTHEATLRRDGTFKVKGSQTGVLVGQRSQYHDYSF